MSEVCRLTLPRTASGPTETFQFKQSRPRAAMRWRGGLDGFLLHAKLEPPVKMDSGHCLC